MPQIKMKKLLVFVLCFGCINQNKGNTYASQKQMKELSKFWSSINTIYQQADHFWDEVATNVSQVIRFETKSTDDSRCYRAIEATFQSGMKNKWSAQMITANSFSKRSLVGGLVADEFSNLGDFDDCLDVSVENEGDEHQLNFAGKYCLASLKTPTLDYYPLAVENEVLANFTTTNYVESLARQWLIVRNRFPYVQGLCVPSVCSEEQIERLLRRYFKGYIDGVNVTVGYCQHRGEAFSPNRGFLIAINIISLAIIFCLFGTVLNLEYLKQLVDFFPVLPTLRKHLSYFDLVRNFNSLFVGKHQSNKSSANEHDLRFIHGLKSILIVIMCIGHSFCYVNVSMFLPMAPWRKYPSNMADFLNFDLLSAFWDKIVLMISVFFIISGFLTMYLTAKKMSGKEEKGGNSNCGHKHRTSTPPPLLPWIGLRWLTLLPSMVGTLCLTIVAQYAGSGPLFHKNITDSYVAPCRYNWWTHILFINNFWPADQMCGINLWFAAALFQLHIIAYIVVYLYFRCRSKTPAFIAASVLAGITFFMLIFFYTGFVGVPLIKSVVGFRFPFPIRAISLVYCSPVLHFMGYFFGVLVALFLLEYKFNAISAKLHLVYSALWGVLVLLLAALHLPAKTEENEQTSFLYSSSTFVILCLIVLINSLWLFSNIIASASSIVRWALSLNLWLPISRLSYGIYLLNPLLIWYNVHLNRDTPVLSIANSTTFSISIYLQSLFLAIILFLLFEAPFSLLVADLTRSRSGQNHEKVSSVSEAVSTRTDSLDMDMTNNNIHNGKGQHPV